VTERPVTAGGHETPRAAEAPQASQAPEAAPPPDRRPRPGWRRAWHRIPLRILGRAATNYAEDRGTVLAAAISYYALFSLFPLTLLVLSVFGIVLRSEEVQQRVLDAIMTQLPIDEGEEGPIANTLRRTAGLGPTLTVLSLLAAFWTASAFAAAIRSALNVIFEVTRRRPFVRGKLMDYLLIPIIGLPFIGGIVLTAAWRLVQGRFEEVPVIGGEFTWAWDLGAFAIPFVLSFIAFTLLYTLIPHRNVRLRYAMVGAFLAALLFETFKFGFAFYLENFASYGVIYGPLASVIVLLFWVFLTANIMLFGAEVSAEAPHVMREEPRHGRPRDEPGEGDWRRSLWAFVRGLVLVGEEETAEPVQDGRRARREAEARAAEAHASGEARE
jgi:membrane protein